MTLSWNSCMYYLMDKPADSGPVDFAKDFVSRLHPDDLDAVLEKFNEAVTSGGRWDQYFRVRWRDGTVLHIHGIGEHFNNATDGTVSFLGTLTDVTELKQLQERELEHVRLEEALLGKLRRNQEASMHQLLRTVSHEIRNPLQAILANTEAMMDMLVTSGVPVKVEDRGSGGRGGGGRSGASTPRDGCLYSREQCDTLADLAEETVGMYVLCNDISGAATPRDGCLYSREQCGTLADLAEEVRVKKLYTESGSVTVDVWHEPAKGDGKEGGDVELVLQISDTGIGIPDTMKRQLFHTLAEHCLNPPPPPPPPAPTSRAGLTATNCEYGTGAGLGLPICQALVHGLGGAIRVRDNAPRGTVMRVAIPCALCAAAPSPPASAAAAEACESTKAPAAQLCQCSSGVAPGQRPCVQGGAAAAAAAAAAAEAEMETALQRCRILAAEDNRINQKVLTRMLAGACAELRMAGDGAEAVAAWDDSGPYGLLLLDIHMPRMGGREAARAIRARAGGDVPVIFLTGEVGLHLRQDLGATFAPCALLHKPASRSSLVEAAKALLVQYAASAPAAAATAAEGGPTQPALAQQQGNAAATGTERARRGALQLAPAPAAAQLLPPTSSLQALPPHLPPTPTALPPTPTTLPPTPMASHQLQALPPTPNSSLQALPPPPTAQPPPPRPRSSGRHRKKNASCGYHGVQPSGNRFRSYIHLRDETGALKQRALGVFDTVEEAALRVNAAVRMFRPNDLQLQVVEVCTSLLLIAVCRPRVPPQHLLNQVPMAMSAADVAAHNGSPSAAATDGADSDVSISSLAENETAYMDDGVSGPGSEAYDPSLQAHVRASPLHNYTGITRNGTKYMAQFNRDGVKLRFGTWDTPIEAALAYNEGIRHLRPDHQHLLNDIPPEEAALYAVSQPRRDQYVASAALRLEEARKRPPAAPFTPGNHPKRARTAALALKAELEAGVLSAEAAMANGGAYAEYYAAAAAAAAPMSPPAVAAAAAAAAAASCGAAAATPGAAAAAQQPALAAVDTAAANAHPQAPPPPQQQQQQRSTPTSRAPHWTAVPPTSTAQPVGTGFVHDLIVNQAPATAAATAAAAAAEPVNSAAAAALRQLTRQADKARTQAALVEHLRTLDASDDVKLEMISNIMGCPRRG
ncbi:hypothetical protein JKP88DRAFT_265068 [Tribonema minus]|uniref:histidine kinase n=1 Tax=Tribonema minus TaxID=303371 RepID=A0A835YKT6_9STRA|nr:hypothetical protein JKP88DRAFT_265068 [Tribonema minus]